MPKLLCLVIAFFCVFAASVFAHNYLLDEAIVFGTLALALFLTCWHFHVREKEIENQTEFQRAFDSYLI